MLYYRGDVLLSTDRCLFCGEMSDCPVGEGGGVSLSSGGDVCFCTRECLHEDSMETPANIIFKMSTGTLGRRGRGVHQCAVCVFCRLGHGDLSETLVSYDIYIML